MTQKKEEKPAAERQVSAVIGRPPFPMEPPPTARRKISEEPFDMDFTSLLEDDV